MEQVIEKLESAYEQCVKKNTELGIREMKLSEQEKLFSERVKKASALEADLKAREVEVRKIEDPLAILTQIKSVKVDVAQESKDLEGRKLAFLSYEAKTRKELALTVVTLNNDKEFVAKELDLVKKDRVKLAEERKNLKEDILKKLSAGVK